MDSDGPGSGPGWLRMEPARACEGRPGADSPRGTLNHRYAYQTGEGDS